MLVTDSDETQPLLNNLSPELLAWSAFVPISSRATAYRIKLPFVPHLPKTKYHEILKLRNMLNVPHFYNEFKETFPYLKYKQMI